MAKMNELRELITKKLSDLTTTYGLKGVYYQNAIDSAMYPHVVYSFDRMLSLTDDRARRDIDLVIDCWDRQNSATLINNLADAIEDALDQENLPQDGILPTIYFEDRKDLLDEDKLIKHIQLSFTIQNYERT